MKIGDVVYRKSFKDCFGEIQPEIGPLKIVHMKNVETKSIQPYRLITAEKVEGSDCRALSCSGHERFFIKNPS